MTHSDGDLSPSCYCCYLQSFPDMDTCTGPFAQMTDGRARIPRVRIPFEFARSTRWIKYQNSISSGIAILRDSSLRFLFPSHPSLHQPPLVSPAAFLHRGTHGVHYINVNARKGEGGCPRGERRYMWHFSLGKQQAAVRMTRIFSRKIHSKCRCRSRRRRRDGGSSVWRARRRPPSRR